MIYILPVKIGDQHWVSISMDGHEQRRGPFDSDAEAQVVAARLAAICRVFCVVPALAPRRQREKHPGDLP